MGILDFFRTRRESPSPETHQLKKNKADTSTEKRPAPFTWKGHFFRYRNMDDSWQQKRSRYLLEQASAHLEDHKIRKGEEGEIELRGKYSDHPVRVILDTWNGTMQLEMKTPHLGWLWLYWSNRLSKEDIPPPEERDDDWADRRQHRTDLPDKGALPGGLQERTG